MIFFFGWIKLFSLLAWSFSSLDIWDDTHRWCSKACDRYPWERKCLWSSRVVSDWFLLLARDNSFSSSLSRAGRCTLSTNGIGCQESQFLSGHSVTTRRSQQISACNGCFLDSSLSQIKGDGDGLFLSSSSRITCYKVNKLFWTTLYYCEGKKCRWSRPWILTLSFTPR